MLFFVIFLIGLNLTDRIAQYLVPLRTEAHQ